MNNEIKEKELNYLLEEIKETTLDYVGTNGCKYQDLLREELNLLLDYITNLQQEKEDYKTRCEKASEYIDKQKKKMYKSRNKIAMFILMKLENILQNGG